MFNVFISQEAGPKKFTAEVKVLEKQLVAIFDAIRDHVRANIYQIAKLGNPKPKDFVAKLSKKEGFTCEYYIGSVPFTLMPAKCARDITGGEEGLEIYDDFIENKMVWHASDAFKEESEEIAARILVELIDACEEDGQGGTSSSSKCPASKNKDGYSMKDSSSNSNKRSVSENDTSSSKKAKDNVSCESPVPAGRGNGLSLQLHSAAHVSGFDQMSPLQVATLNSLLTGKALPSPNKALPSPDAEEVDAEFDEAYEQKEREILHQQQQNQVVSLHSPKGGSFISESNNNYSSADSDSGSVSNFSDDDDEDEEAEEGIGPIHYVPALNFDSKKAYSFPSDDSDIMNVEFTTFVLSRDVFEKAKSTDMTKVIKRRPGAAVVKKKRESYGPAKTTRAPRSRTAELVAIYNIHNLSSCTDLVTGVVEELKLSSDQRHVKVKAATDKFVDFLVQHVKEEVARDFLFESKCVELICQIRSTLRVHNSDYIMIPWVEILGRIGARIRESFKRYCGMIRDKYLDKIRDNYHAKIANDEQVEDALSVKMEKKVCKDSMLAFTKKYDKKVNNTVHSTGQKLVDLMLGAQHIARADTKVKKVKKWNFFSTIVTTFQVENDRPLVEESTLIASPVDDADVMDHVAATIALPPSASSSNQVQLGTSSPGERRVAVEEALNCAVPRVEGTFACSTPSFDLLSAMFQKCDFNSNEIKQLVLISRTKDPYAKYPVSNEESLKYFTKLQLTRMTKKNTPEPASNPLVPAPDSSLVAVDVSPQSSTSALFSTHPSAVTTTQGSNLTNSTEIKREDSGVESTFSQLKLQDSSSSVTALTSPRMESPITQMKLPDSSASSAMVDAALLTPQKRISILDGESRSSPYIADRIWESLRTLMKALTWNVTASWGRFTCILMKNTPPHEGVPQRAMEFYKSVLNILELMEADRAAEPEFTLLHAHLYVSYKSGDCSNTLGNGYCYYTSVYQALLNERSGYTMPVEELKDAVLMFHSADCSDEDRAVFQDHLARVKEGIKSDTEDRHKAHLARAEGAKHSYQTQSRGEGLDLGFWGVGEWIAETDVACTLFEAITPNHLPSGMHCNASKLPAGKQAYLSASSHVRGEVLQITSWKDIETVMTGHIPNFIVHNVNHFFIVDNPTASDCKEAFTCLRTKIADDLRLKLAKIQGLKDIVALVKKKLHGEKLTADDQRDGVDLLFSAKKAVLSTASVPELVDIAMQDDIEQSTALQAEVERLKAKMLKMGVMIKQLRNENAKLSGEKVAKRDNTSASSQNTSYDAVGALAHSEGTPLRA